uniref:Uncharacterized protein n=1 Tax=Anguilla anguilla TaxID=7936 RepID=A0A0E9UWU1_ANGAN
MKCLRECGQFGLLSDCAILLVFNDPIRSLLVLLQY